MLYSSSVLAYRSTISPSHSGLVCCSSEGASFPSSGDLSSASGVFSWGGTAPVIGTVYRNYHRPALIITFIFPDILLKILRTSSQGRTCPSRTHACLIKHYSKQPIGAPRLNLVPAVPKLYKVAFHHVLVGIPTLTVHHLQGIPTPQSPQQLTQRTQLTQLVLSRF